MNKFSKLTENTEGKYFEYGTVEGVLTSINDANGGIKILITDILYSNPITCYISEDMIDEILGNFRSRIEVEGKINFRKDGTPLQIEVTNFKKLPNDEDLPGLEEILGILRDLMAIEKVYWDSNCFLSILNKEAETSDKCVSVIERATRGEIVILTSALTIAEVLWMKCQSLKIWRWWYEQI